MTREESEVTKERENSRERAEVTTREEEGDFGNLSCVTYVRVLFNIL